MTVAARLAEIRARCDLVLEKHTERQGNRTLDDPRFGNEIQLARTDVPLLLAVAEAAVDALPLVGKAMQGTERPDEYDVLKAALAALKAG